MKKIVSPSKSVCSLNVSQIAQNNPNRPFTFQSQSQSQDKNDQSHIIIHQNYPTYCHHQSQSEKDEQTDQNSQYREHLQKEYKMRIQSVIKGYEVKLSREQETFQLKQMKYQQEIQYLKRQVKELSIFGCKDNGKNTGLDDRCSICSNGEVVNFMKNMLQAVQNDHRGCISEKAITNAQIITLEQKIKVLQIQNEQLEQRSQKLKQQNKQLRSQKQTWQRQKREKERQHRELERNFQVKEMTFEQENIKNIAMQKELENQIKKVQLKHIEAVHGHQNASRPMSKTVPIGQPMYHEEYAKNNYYENQQNYVFRDIQNHPESIPLLRPSLKSPNPYTNIHSTINRQSSSLKKSSIAANWRTKMEQSYADYAKSKRKPKKEQNYYGVAHQNYPPTSQNFDTFRPTMPALSTVPSTRGKMVSSLIGNQQKYNYLD